MPFSSRRAGLMTAALLAAALPYCAPSMAQGTPAAAPAAGAAPSREAANARFHARIAKLYAFTPHTMNQEQVTAKVRELTVFWDEVKADPAANLPRLRAELKDARNPSYFAFDGGKLLITLSKEPADLAIALEAMPRADLRDADNAEYLIAVHWFARKGLDTTRAALHMLDYPGFQAPNAGRGVNLNQGYALIFALFPLPEPRFVPALAERLRTEKNEVAQRSLALALWYSATPEGRRALENYVGDRSKPQAGRDMMRKLLTEAVPAKVPASQASEEELREMRRKAMGKIEPLALHALDTYTAQIYRKQQQQ